ncbi:hypothetical protein [Sinorhizobium psoraleae]|uniref:Uncharacterized protein n=1 Tax=Sinorhizobium psoraleae TaxID=520838 RepID=A0ABT4KAS6_9HYPH|nr:hypothetical protein [Sinorhizobium psoraleae]MCZ4089075.1 hypothetical protein [Sinorhizobium psoraleae]
MMRQADYTRKTQELAEQRKVYQQVQFDANAVRQEAIQHIERSKMEILQIFNQMEQPDWEYLIENDPAEFQRQQWIWGKREAKLRELHNEHLALQQQTQEYEAQQHQIALQESKARLYEKYPEFRDATVSRKALEDMHQTLLKHNFTNEEMQGLTDDRIISLVYEYTKLLNAQQAIPEVVAKIEQKPFISQKNTSAKTSDAYTKAKSQFNKPVRATILQRCSHNRSNRNSSQRANNKRGFKPKCLPLLLTKSATLVKTLSMQSRPLSRRKLRFSLRSARARQATPVMNT